jgi:hypothetical protein
MAGFLFGLCGRGVNETIKQTSLLQHRTGDEGYHRNPFPIA